MGAAEDDTETAAAQLRLLNRHFREHPRTGPAIRTAPSTIPGAPVNLAVVDHITASIREVTDDTYTLNPQASPLPDRLDSVYAWYRANTRNAPEAQQQRRDTVIYRQRLEHAITMGDAKVVRRHRCPACQTLGLFWPPEVRDPKRGRAVCANRRCLTAEGMTRTWTLARLAYEHVAIQKTLRDCAT